jgi:hypothetical protein
MVGKFRFPITKTTMAVRMCLNRSWDTQFTSNTFSVSICIYRWLPSSTPPIGGIGVRTVHLGKSLPYGKDLPLALAIFPHDFRYHTPSYFLPQPHPAAAPLTASLLFLVAATRKLSEAPFHVLSKFPSYSLSCTITSQFASVVPKQLYYLTALIELAHNCHF